MNKMINSELLMKDTSFREHVYNIENIKITMVTRDAMPFSGQKKVYSPMHTHSCYELIGGGDCDFNLVFEDEILNLNIGDLVVVSPNIMHKCEDVSKAGIGLQFDIAPNGVSGGPDLYGMLTEIIKKDHTYIPKCPDVGKLMLDIDAKEESGDWLSIGLLFYEIIIRLISATIGMPNAKSINQPDSDSLRKYKIQTLIHHNFMRDVSLEEIADALHLSPRQASRLVKDYFGCTFKDLIVKMRMEKTAHMLLNSDWSVFKIAQSVGYSSVRGFYSAFKNYYGCLPAEYKNKAKE
ncbi:MAG: helix-turn-helix transcriptional regulator [Clostridia bacterium]|nr:helix-turn-helix transcriptional regulator [Clostridia bacterium]